MLAHAIHLANGRAAGEQRPVHRLLVRQRQPGGGKTEQRRAAARNQGNDQVVLRQVLDHVKNTFRRLLASQVGDGMRRLHDLDLSALRAVTVARDDQSLERPVPVVLYGASHGGGGFPGADHDCSASRRLRQARRDHFRRKRRFNRRGEHSSQQLTRRV